MGFDVVKCSFGFLRIAKVLFLLSTPWHHAGHDPIPKAPQEMKKIVLSMDYDNSSGEAARLSLVFLLPGCPQSHTVA